MQLLILSHCGTCGHRGCDATLSILKEDFYWKSMKEDVAEFVRGCLHCLVSRSGEIIPRPYGHGLHGRYPNEVIHVDYLYMGSSVSQKSYCLLIRDDLSSYIWLWPTEAATAEHAADALSMWSSVFGPSKWLVTDQGRHFCNTLIHNLTQDLKIDHHFTTAYCPWSNGSIERVCREVLRACRAVLHEFCLSPKDWPAVTECIQSVINQAPLKRLGPRNAVETTVYRTPLEVFTSHRPTRPLLRALPIEEYGSVQSLEEVRAQQLIGITETQAALENVHRNVNDRVTTSRQKAIEFHNNRTNVRHANFDVGDFVLVRKAQRKWHKLQFLLKRPKRIVEVKSDWVFVVENLLNSKREIVHSRRLMFNKAKLDGKEVDDSLFKYAEHSEALYQTAHQTVDIREDTAGLELKVEWLGLPDENDYTWEPLEILKDDIPGMLHDYSLTSSKRNLKRKAFRLCNFE